MLADVLLIGLVLRKDYRCVNISIKTMFIGILACYLLMYCKFIKKNRYNKVGGVRFHTIYMFVVLFYFRLRKLWYYCTKLRVEMVGWCYASAQALSVTWLSVRRNSVLISFAVVVLWWYQV